jgi:hypothetical protein
MVTSLDILHIEANHKVDVSIQPSIICEMNMHKNYTFLTVSYAAPEYRSVPTEMSTLLIELQSVFLHAWHYPEKNTHVYSV